MAEAVLGVVTAISNKVLPLAADEISRAWGVKKELEKLSQNVEMAQALLSDVKGKQLTSSNTVQRWLKKLQSRVLDAEIVLDDFGYEVLRQKVENRKRDKVRNFFSSSNPVSFGLGMANKIKNVSSSLEEVFKEASQIGLRPVELIMTSLDHTEDRVTVPFVDESEIVGREDDVSKMVSMLISSDYKKDLPVISIVGMAGQGKTTLAQVVLKDDNVGKYFDKRIWVCVSDEFEVEKLLNEMLQSLGETKAMTTNRESLVRKLQENLKGKRYLLVLDDIWNEDREKWERMRTCLLEIGGAQGSKILGTTRSDDVASAMLTSNYHLLGVLSTDFSWMLFEKIAFADGGARKIPELETIGSRILKRCGGVPLAIKAIGGLLYSRKDQSEWSMIERSELWNDRSSIADGVFSALKLSYEHLPSLSVKQCFASCSIFPKDKVIKKEDLIQIWMAQGLISHPKGGHLQMEDIGSNYFNILLRSSLLQNPKKDIYNNIISCKMHDLVHDFSLEVSNNYIFDTDDGMVINKDADFVHLTLISREGKMLKNMEGIPPKLRTLYLIDCVVVEDFLKRFKYLCVLKLKSWKLDNLPNAVGEMKHLRDLDISETHIITLPDSITKLYNLMTLRVYYLEGIPKRFGNLINLRHFYCYRFSEGCLLPGVGQLPNLQTLSIFVVSQDKGCQIEELGRLHNLKGKIEIYGLQNVSSYESAANANLSGKSNIRDLKLGWDRTEDRENSMDVMEGLQPHLNLKSLTIEGFNGSKLPSWMGSENHLILLRKLVKISLMNLNSCEQLPSFGDLPSLQILEMSHLPKVKCIGIEFYGREILESARRGISSCKGTTTTLFPALRGLALSKMDSLVEWTDAMIPSDPSSIKVFPNLEELSLVGLPKLTGLPDMVNLTCLQKLQLDSCGSLTCLRNLNRLSSLQCLMLIKCPSLDAYNLDATNLRDLCLGIYSEDLDYFPWPFSISSGFTTTNDADGIKQHFVSLESLTLYGCPKIQSLPEQIQHLSTLRRLYIEYFHGLEALPEWLGSFQNLEFLRVEYCSNLKQLPSVEAMNRLTNLRQLEIYHCHLLAERCTRGSGVDWHKIAHIPSITINFKRV